MYDTYVSLDDYGKIYGTCVLFFLFLRIPHPILGEFWLIGGEKVHAFGSFFYINGDGIETLDQ